MYNQQGPWGGDPGGPFGAAPFGGPPPFMVDHGRGRPPNPGIRAFGSRADMQHPGGQMYGRHPEMDFRGGRGGRDPGAHFGSRDLRHDRDYDRDYEEERRERPRRRSRSRSPPPTSRGSHDRPHGEREWDRGKRPSGRGSPPPRSYDREDDLRDHDRNRDRRSFQDDPPSKTVMLRNLPGACFEAEVRYALGPELGGFADIRVPRNTEGGNRGFGFIEFPDIPTAVTWMEQVQGLMTINDQRVVARFSESRELPFKKREDRESRPPAQALPADWECARCGCNNFRHRNTCFRCEAARTEAEIVNIPSADDQVGLSPCSTLLLRNLDILTDEAKIASALGTVLGNISPRTTKIVKDPRNNQSVGYGFAQFKSVADSTEMYNCLMKTNPPLTIDGKQVSVSFAKNGLNEHPQQHVSFSVLPPAVSAGPRAAGGPGYDQGNNANSAAAVAQLALQQLQKTQMSANVVHSSIAAMQAHGQTAFSMPGYQYDAASGLYFSPSSKMYYDPKTQYFFNPETQQYLMWNAHTRQYVQVVGQMAAVPAAAGTSAVAAPSPSVEVPKPIEDKPKPEDEKRKQAEKIVQEMEKWAKAMNQKQPQTAKKPPAPEIKIGVVASVFKDDGGDEVTEAEVIGSKLSYKSMSIPGKSSAVAVAPESSHSASPAEHPEREASRSPPGSALLPENSSGLAQHMAAERKLVDWERFACLLCKRQLQTKDQLQKHMEMSELHLCNLAKWREKNMTEAEIEEIEASERESRYRDRAKERRQKHGDLEPAPLPRERATSSTGKSARKRPAEMFEPSPEEDSSAPAAGLGSHNVGSKLLKKIGWKEGEGLGKSQQGIVDPVEARGQIGTSGLGASEGAPDILPNDTYANKVRKTMRQRFNQMQE